MMRHVLRSGRPSKIAQSDEPSALFALMIAVFYDDAVIANGYGESIGLYSPHNGRCRASQVK